MHEVKHVYGYMVGEDFFTDYAAAQTRVYEKSLEDAIARDFSAIEVDRQQLFDIVLTLRARGWTIDWPVVLYQRTAEQPVEDVQDAPQVHVEVPAQKPIDDDDIPF